MRKSFLKLTYILFTVCCICLFGCGEDDYGADYTSSVSFQDGDEEGVLTLDMYQSQCEAVDPASPFANVLEIFTDVFADIEITTAENVDGLTLNGYTIEYIPELSEDGTHTLILPPTLNSLVDKGSNNIYMPTNSTTSFTITCFSTDQKFDYATLMVGNTLDVSRYTIRIILFCTADSGQKKSIEIRRTVYFGNYYRC